MNFLFKKFTVYSMIACLLMVPFMLVLGPTQTASAADEFDSLRNRWKTYLTGGSEIDPSDPDIAAQIKKIDSEASRFWSSMDKSTGRTFLWSNLSDWSSPSPVMHSYGHLKAMALAYATTGSSLHGNTSLATDIISGMDWMYANKYNEKKSEFGNWWHWEIGIPQILSDLMVLVYDQLSVAQIANYAKVMDRFNPDPTKRTNSGVPETGANRMDKAFVVALRGVIAKSSAKIAQGRDAVSSSLWYSDKGDGFYEDGSYKDHGSIAYTGGYGAVLISNMAKMIYLIGGSSWNITDPNVKNVIRWVTEVYQPFLYKGAMMDTVRGRSIARESEQDHQIGRSVIASLLLLAEGMNGQDAITTRRIVKGQAASDTTFASYTYGLPIYSIVKFKELLGDSTVVPAADLIKTHVFANMDRALQLRSNFGLALGMFSTRVSAFETFGTENTRPFWQGTGTAYLYNSDQKQFNGAYWPTVNSVRLPGTTTDGSTRDPMAGATAFNTSDWVGGSSVGDLYGSVGMQFSMSKNTGTPLSGKKSWFLFGDKYIALGADITSTGGRTVETIVENRKLNADGTNTLTVGGTVKPSTTGWSETMTGVQWAHLAGSVPGSDIAYVFPGGATVNGLRETRTGSWNDIYVGSSSTPMSAHYASLALNHGINPTQASYAYAVLPGKTAAEAAAYAANPGFAILKNSGTAQAVKDTGANVVGANFWTDSVDTIQVDGSDYLTSNKKASVTVAENGTELQIGIADPTQANKGTIEIELHRATSGVIALDSGVTVKQFAPTTKLEVKTAGLMGKTILAKLNIGSPTTPAAPQLTEIKNDGEGSVMLKWNGEMGATGYRIYYGKTAGNYTHSIDVPTVSAGDNSYTVTGLTNKTTYYFTVKAVNASGESASSNEMSFVLPDGVWLAPTADTYVRDGSYENTNYGEDSTLNVKNEVTERNRHSYLKFDVNSFAGSMKSAKVRLVPISMDMSGVSHQANIVADDTWSESGMTWSNQPQIGALLANWTVPAVRMPVEFDVTSAVYDALSTDKTFSIRIMATKNYGKDGIVNYASKENATANYRPVLFIEQLTSPAAPQLTEIKNDGDGSVMLKWNGEMGVTGYRIYYGKTAGNYTHSIDVPTVSAGDNSYTVTGLTNKTTYYFTVKAVNALGESASSNEMSIALPDGVWLAPTADTYVRDGSYANTNYGEDSTLTVKNEVTERNRHSYLKFDVTSFAGSMKSAKVQLVPISMDMSGVSHQANIVADDTWSESGMTWSNQPQIGALLANWTVPAVGTPVEFDVTSAVYDALSTDKTFSIRIMATKNYGKDGVVNYASKENATANYRPVLSITPVEPPVTTDDAKQGWQTAAQSVKLTAVDQGSGVAHTFYSVDGGSYAEGTTIEISGDGVHTITYYSVDTAGNREAEKTAVVKIDKTAPITTDDAKAGWQNTTQTVILGAADQTSGVKVTYYSVDDGSFVQGNSIVLSDEGVHTIRYYSTDEAGNKEQTKAVQVSIDRTAPVVQTTAVTSVSPSTVTIAVYRTEAVSIDRIAPVVQTTAVTSVSPSAVTIAVYRTEAVSIPVTITDALSGVAKAEVKLDGTVVNQSVTAAPLTLSIGEHPIVVTATDNAGNITVREYVLRVMMDVDHLDEELQLAGSEGWIANQGILNSLLAKVDNIQKQHSDINQVLNSLNALENEVRAQSGKQIETAFANLLLDDIAYLRTHIKH